MLVVLAGIAGVAGIGGCSSTPRTSEKLTASNYSSFESARDAFLQIVPGETTSDELRALGIDPAKEGTTIVGSMGLSARLVPFNAALVNTEQPLDLLSENLPQCAGMGQRCEIWITRYARLRAKRRNPWLELLRFRRMRDKTGWRFDGAVVLMDGIAVESVWGGIPRIHELNDRIRPLGPFQAGKRIKIVRNRKSRLILRDEDSGEPF